MEGEDPINAYSVNDRHYFGTRGVFSGLDNRIGLLPVDQLVLRASDANLTI